MNIIDQIRENFRKDDQERANRRALVAAGILLLSLSSIGLVSSLIHLNDHYGKQDRLTQEIRGTL